MKSIYRFKGKDIAISTRKKNRPFWGVFLPTRRERRSPHRRPAALEAAGGHDRLRSGQEPVGVCRGRGGGPRLLGLRRLRRAGLRRLLRLGLRRLGTGLLPGLYFRRGLGGGRCRAHRGWLRGRRRRGGLRGHALRLLVLAASAAEQPREETAGRGLR